MNSADESPAVLLEQAHSIAIVRFNRLARRNALSSETLTQLEAIISSPTLSAVCTAIIFTGTGNTFASGADIREIATLNSESARPFAERGQKLFQQIALASQLTIAAINGFCMGGALDLALACDVRVASASAVFAHPGANLGIITGWGGTQRLPRLLGRARAFELLMTSRRFDAIEALQMGLITQVADPVLNCAIEICNHLGGRGGDILSNI